MNTYREIVYLILDELRLVSDDSTFTEEHICFLMDKYRALLLKKYYSSIKKEIPESNYQTLCLSLEDSSSDICGIKPMLKSIQDVPDIMELGHVSVFPVNEMMGDIAFVTPNRMKYVGFNKYLKNIIYACIASDHKLYITSCNPNSMHLEQVKIKALFENSEKAAILNCNNSSEAKCDVLESEFPLEESLIPELVSGIVQELSGALYKLSDNINNSTDDNADIATAVQTAAAAKKKSKE